MRRARIPAVLQRMAKDMRDERGNPRRGGVLHVPRILDCEAWEVLASVQQDALIAAASEDRRGRIE